MMKLRLKQTRLFAGIIAFGMILSPMTVQAKTTRNYIYNEYAEAVKAPSAYVCEQVLRGREIGIGDFSGISDIYVNEQIYISDTGNNRIVVLDPEYRLVRSIDAVIENGASVPLNRPQGTFVRDDLLYICESGNARVIAVDENDTVVRTYVKPDSDLLTEDFDYRPSKVVVNSAGSVFVAASGVYQGILQYDNSGTFLGFFGANKVEVTMDVILRSFWQNIFSQEQRESLVRTVPTEYAGIFIDEENMIYTTTISATESQVKRLNASGENILFYPGSNGGILQKGYNRNNFGDQEVEYARGGLRPSQIMDVEVDEDGIIAVLDAYHGRVFVFDREQNPLCIFGGSGTQNGDFQEASALGRNGEEYLVADSVKNSVTIFQPTEYMQDIKSALREYSLGNYARSREYWEKVLEKNAGLAVAFKGVGRALYLEDDYGEAMEYLRRGDDRYYYSLALTGFRREFLRDNVIWLFPTAAAGAAAVYIGLRAVYRALIRSGEKGKGRR